MMINLIHTVLSKKTSVDYDLVYIPSLVHVCTRINSIELESKHYSQSLQACIHGRYYNQLF